MPWQPLARLEEVPEGGLREVFAGEPLLLVRVGGEVHCVAAVCPHKFGLMAEGELAGHHLTCPVHTATFDVRTGQPQPGQEWAGRLATYPVRVVAGVVEADVPGA